MREQEALGKQGAAASAARRTVPDQAAGSFLSLDLQTRDEQIGDRLVTAIALGEYVPGQRLPSERELAAALGVSRRTVRSALHHLESEGFIEIRRGRSGGAYVLSSWGRSSRAMVARTLLPHWDAFEDLLDLRLAVEQLIAAKAAERSNENDLAAIRECLEAYRAAPGRAESRAADTRFHEAIAVAARSPVLANLSRRLRAEITLGFNAVPWSEEIRDRAIEDHDRYMAALEAGDVDRIREVVAEHLTLTASALRQLRERVAEGAEEWDGEVDAIPDPPPTDP